MTSMPKSEMAGADLAVIEADREMLGRLLARIEERLFAVAA